MGIAVTLDGEKIILIVKLFAISNSNPQREAITAQAKARNFQKPYGFDSGYQSISPETKFDRVVSIEMFEHMRNYQLLMENISSWFKVDGKLFVHVFCHQKYAYFFETAGSDNWMGRYFFTGGIMPSEDLLANFQKDLSLEKQWRWDGRHYMKTSNAWLKNMDEKRSSILPIFRNVYGEGAESDLVSKMENVFYGLCRIVWLQPRKRMVRFSLFIQK